MIVIGAAANSRRPDGRLVHLSPRIPMLTSYCPLAFLLAAREVASHDGPLTPDDLREAYRLYQLEHERNGVPRRKLFTR